MSFTLKNIMIFRLFYNLFDFVNFKNVIKYPKVMQMAKQVFT
jgi:hypothetical protein